MFNFFRRRRSQQDAAQGPVKQDLRSAGELYESTGRSLADAPPVTQDILRLAEDAHRRRHSDPERDDALEKEQPGLPVTGNDDAVLALFAGTQFGPNASVTLPSGTTLDAEEAQTWTDLYRRNPERGR